MEIDLTVMMEIDEMFSGILNHAISDYLFLEILLYKILVHRKNIDFIRLRL